jgi:hypothetical protein
MTQILNNFQVQAANDPNSTPTGFGFASFGIWICLDLGSRI